MVLVNQAVIQLEGHIVGYVTLQSVAMEGIMITNHHSGSVGYTTLCVRGLVECLLLTSS